MCVYLSPNDFNPHLFSHVNNVRGILDTWDRHLTHMHQTCYMSREKNPPLSDQIIQQKNVHRNKLCITVIY